jgi:predicted nuclease of predicted toxin-antitoxin system
VKLKLDENLPVEIADDLRLAGHDVHTVFDEGLSGADDTVLMAAVQRESRAILTLDKGIANVQRYPPQDYAGIVLFRPPGAGRGVVLDFVRRRLGSTLPLLVAGALVVVSERSIRVR